MTRNTPEYTRAARRADAKLGFLCHLAIYLVAAPILVVTNLADTPDQFSLPWSVGGWSLGLLIHGLAVYAHVGGLRRRLVEAELRRIEH